MPRFFMSSRSILKSVRPAILFLIQTNPVQSHRTYATLAVERMQVREDFLKRLGLSNLKLTWPESAKRSELVDYTKKNPKSVRQMYGDADLSKLPIFKGGFINFGYWPNSFLSDKEISEDQRIAASKEMYKVIIDLIGTVKEQNLLEVGSGLGYGSQYVSQCYQPRLVVGLDISPDQIARAKKYQVDGIKSGKLRFTIGEAESMPFTDHSFDAVISVEAAQHFSSTSSFSKEVSRVLKPGGRLIVTSFFPRCKEGVEAMNAIVPDYHIHGSQRTVDEVAADLSNNMENVVVSSIGENVWHGFSKWLDQIGYETQWSKIWPALYQKKLVDYVIYRANSPKEHVKSHNVRFGV